MTSDPSWPVVILDDVADDITVGHVGPMATQYVPAGVPFLRSQNVERFRLSLDDVNYVSQDFHARLVKSALQPGDVVIVRTGRPGSAAVIPSDLPVANCSDLVIVRPGPKLDAHYLMYFINSAGSGHVASHLVGAVQQHFNVGSARTLRIPLPPLPEQRRITRALGALDDRIELNRRMNRTFESITRALFKSWFVDFDPVNKRMQASEVGLPMDVAALFPSSLDDSPLGRIPSGWDVAPCDREFRITMGQSPPGTSYNEEGEGLPFFQGCRDFGSRYPTRRVFCTAPSRFADSGDTLVSVRAPVGRVNQSTERCCIGRGLAGVRHRLDVPCYTFESMRSLEAAFRDFDSGGTVFGSISGKDFANLRVLVPPRPLLEAYEKTVEPLLQLVAKNEEASTALAATREAILPPLLTGSWSGGKTVG